MYALSNGQNTNEAVVLGSERQDIYVEAEATESDDNSIRLSPTITAVSSHHALAGESCGLLNLCGERMAYRQEGRRAITPE
jgi:hypothetical protein